MGASTVDLLLTQPEAQHIALTVDALADYPDGGDKAGGECFRLQFLRLYDADGPHMLALTRDELWLLDTQLLHPDPRGVKLPDGTPVLTLLVKIWAALLEAYAEGGGHAADADNYPDAHHAGHGAAPAVETV